MGPGCRKMIHVVSCLSTLMEVSCCNAGLASAFTTCKRSCAGGLPFGCRPRRGCVCRDASLCGRPFPLPPSSLGALASCVCLAGSSFSTASPYFCRRAPKHSWMSTSMVPEMQSTVHLDGCCLGALVTAPQCSQGDPEVLNLEHNLAAGFLMSGRMR